MNKIHFHSIDALRFFAFLKVYFLHVPIDGVFPILQFLKSGGGIGVSFFFVLSGFLISYLLSYEKSKTNRINLKNFLIRRSLRIWPLFYLMVIMAFVLPYSFKQDIGFHMIGGGYELDWIYSFTFLENYKIILEDSFPKTTPLSVFWSLCIEEHFYLVWVIAFYLIPFKHILKFLGASVAISWLARFLEIQFSKNNSIFQMDLFTNLDYFAIGGILGYFVVVNYNYLSSRILSIPTKTRIAYIILVLLVVVFQNIILPYNPNSLFFIFRPTIIAVLFTLLLAVFIAKNSAIAIKNKTLNYLGSISYGLYVYHILIIHLYYNYCLNNNIKIDSILSISLTFVITLGASILLSILSYRYFEKPFLNMRDSITKLKKN